MSTHVVPRAERLQHVLTMECPCRPVMQSAIDGTGEGPAWVVAHHELAEVTDPHEDDGS